MDMRLKRWVLVSMLTAMAAVVSYLESFIPVFVPGVKLGLANVIVLIALYELKSYEALVVDVLRILIVSLIRGMIFTPTFIMSMSGGMISFFVMWVFSRIKIFSPIGVGVLGSVFHCVGQIAVAMIIMGTQAVVYYLPFIGALSIATGVLTGVITAVYLKRSITYKFVDVNKNKS